MAKNSWNDYSATAANNTDVGNVNTSETMNPSDVNDAVRELMSHTADVVAGTVALSSINIDGGSVTGITDLAVADGGTGASTLTANGVLFGNGTSAIGVTAVGTSGQVLTSNGSSAPTFQDAATTYTHPNHSGEVTSTGDGATVIASNVVDEDNLKVSNAPTNGYILTARSGNTGGLTWEAAAGGGATDINGLSDGVTNSSGGTVGLGTDALSNDDGSANQNTALGYQALYTTNSNFQNTAVGYQAGYALNGTGDVFAGRQHSLFGAGAGKALTTGQWNTVMGAFALDVATTPSGNSVFGYEAGGAVTTGANNVFVGNNAGNTTTTGSNNIILGNTGAASSATVANEITLGNTAITKFRIPGIDFVLKDNGGTPTTGQILTADGSGEGYWATPAGGGATDINGLSDAKKLGTSTYGIGSGALADTTAALDGNFNTAIGADAGGGTKGNGAGNNPFDNTFIGSSAGYGVNQTGGTASNVAIGRRAMQLHTGCIANVIIGKDAGAAISTGSSNTGVGEQSLVTATTAGQCTNVGRFSGRNITTGSNNTSLGYDAGSLTTTGVNNTSLGYQAIPSSATVSNEITLGNTAVTKFRVPGINFTVKDTVATEDYVLTVDANGEAGWEAAGGGGATDINGLSDALTHSNGDTIGLGTLALANDDGSGTNNNTAVGKSSLTNTTSGENNTAIGNNSGVSNTTGAHNTFLGANSGQIGTLTGSFNTAIGSTSLRQIQGTASDNIGSGYWSGYSLTTGRRNIILGRQAMYTATTAESNVAIGWTAGYSVTTGVGNVMIGMQAGNLHTTGDDNVFIGRRAGHGAFVASTGNVAIGAEALNAQSGGYGNVCVGRESGKAITSGNSNTFIGNLVNSSQTTTGSNNITLGANSTASSATVSNEITLGNSSISSLRCQVQTISSLSDRRDKKDIEELPLGVDFINTLKPVKFTWNMRDGAKVGQQEAGFIAQDLDEAQIDADAEDYLSLVLKNNPEKLEASYGKLVPVLVKAVQELSAEIKNLKKEIKNG